MAVLLLKTDSKAERWVQALRSGTTGLHVRVWPDVGRRNEIEYVLAWKPSQALFTGLTSLKAIFSVGAGVDHLQGDLQLPVGVPVIRMVEESLPVGMTEYVLFNVLRFHRQFHVYESHQRQRLWKPLGQTPPDQRTIGVLGLGVLGVSVARRLVDLGFNVLGYSRSPKKINNIHCFSGSQGLDEFLARVQILICLLPLTSQTRGIINASFLSRLPTGSYVINAGRGGHIVESDLLRALDSGHIEGAALDVFETEPLPSDSEFWDHPKVWITPHVAAQTAPETAAVQILRDIEKIEAGKSPEYLADMNRGY